MLTDYNATGIAGIMGLAFVEKAEGVKPATDDAVDAFIITVGDVMHSVVEAWSLHDVPSSSQRLQASPPTAVLIEKAVEKGLPRHALRHVAEWLAGGDKAKASALEWGVVPKTTLDRRQTHLSPQESERTERVARLAMHALRALGSAAEAREFMTTPHPELDGRSPIEAAKTDLGTRHVEQVLHALEYGLAL
jgi:putative toxin-antitoxin system antitoxin component (TIGR02293 family)